MLYGASSLSVLIVMIIRDLVMEQHRTLFYTVRSLLVKIEYFKTLMFFILASTGVFLTTFLTKSYMTRTHSQWQDLINIPMHIKICTNELSRSIQNTNERLMSIQNTNWGYQNTNEQSRSIQNTNERFMSIQNTNWGYQNTNLNFIIPTTKSAVLKMFKIPTDPIKIPTDPIKIPTDPIKIPIKLVLWSLVFWPLVFWYRPACASKYWWSPQSW